MQGGRRRQTGLGVPRADRDTAVDGKTVGRHYAGPSWEHSDGSAVVGKAVGNAPGATPMTFPG